MTMALDPAALERLIEEGLTLYGQGDLDGALLLWEQVLADDPENAQANSYVDYVRMNYELLTSEPAEDASAPFGIASDSEPEYIIEISPGEAVSTPELTKLVKADAARTYMDALDEGWSMDDDEGTTSDAARHDHTTETTAAPPGPGTIELDEPSGPAVNFEDATREYDPSMRKPSAVPPEAEFTSEGTPGFGSAQDVSFGNQLTDVRKRDLGFVKTALGLSEKPRPKRASVPELEITLRTPEGAHDHDDHTKENPPAPEVSAFELSYSTADLDLPTGAHPPLGEVDPEDLLALPNPTSSVTRDLPANLVRPSPATASAIQRSIEALELDLPIEPPLPASGAPTRELGADLLVAFAKSRDHTHDFSEKPTREIGQRLGLEGLDPLISAPTRELGLRPGSVGAQPVLPQSEGTRHDIVLPFDPIDARTAQILDGVDQGAPANEPKEEQTRRRITLLLERAAEWSTSNELDKAVAAVDLALSEDPNSALAQKLIQRNRDTIMQVFQAFLGDLERQPALARPLHELSTAPISPRAAFLLSRVDGMMSIDEILDVSGMPRLEAYRYLCQLFLRGILR